MLPPDDPETARRFGLVKSNDNVLLSVSAWLIIVAWLLVTALMIVLVDQWIYGALYGIFTAGLGALFMTLIVWHRDPDFFRLTNPNATPDI